MASRRRLLMVLAGTTAIMGSVLGIGTGAAAEEAQSWSISKVVGGLALPRGIALDGEGAMYVAESGLPGPGASGLTQGAVDKYTLGATPTRVWSSPFTSAYMGAGGNTDVIGPSGLSTVGDECTRRDEGERGGCAVSVIVGLNQHDIPAGQFGHLYTLDPMTGARTERGDIGSQNYAWTAAHSSLFSDFPDANPYGVLTTQGEETRANRTYVVDAAANTVSAIAPDGTATVIAYIPNETPVKGLPTRDATPTCAAQGPDGALYIGTLDLLRNFADPKQGWSNVYRVEPRAHKGYLTAAHLWASGLTAVTACTFDSDGNFWATEMFKNNPTGPPGDVVRIPFHHPSRVQHIGGGQVPFPGGVARGDDGSVYVTIFSAGTNAANGGVVRISES